MLDSQTQHEEPAAAAPPGEGAPPQAGAADAPPVVAPAAPGEGAPPQQAGALVGGGKVMTLLHSDFKRIKQESQDRGRKAALAEFEQQAQQLGYASAAEMFAAAAEARRRAKPPAARPPADDEDDDEQPAAATPPAPPAASASPTDKKGEEKWRREVEKARAERAALEERARKADAQARRERQARFASEARSALEKAAMSEGIKDPDFAIHLLMRELDGKSAEELQGFDERAFFQTLRESRPYLFGEVERPATTGTGSRQQPAAPKPETAVRGAAGAGGQNGFDAMKADKKSWEEWLAQRGLNLTM